MSLYVVRILDPQGVWGYLSRGKRVFLTNATRYSHPSAAKTAAAEYRRKHDAKAQPTEAKVMDTRHMCSRCEHNFGEVPGGIGFACEDRWCAVKGLD